MALEQCTKENGRMVMYKYALLFKDFTYQGIRYITKILRLRNLNIA